MINPVCVKLALPPQYRFHPVFHVSLLKPFQPLTRITMPPSALDVDGVPQFEVKAVLDSKRVRGKLYYLVDLKGYGPEERSWEPLANLQHAPRLVKTSSPVP